MLALCCLAYVGLCHALDSEEPPILWIFWPQLSSFGCTARPFHVDQVLAACPQRPMRNYIASGITSPAGEQCLCASGAPHLEPCLEAVAAGDGSEVFQLTEEQHRQPGCSCRCGLLV